MESTQSNEHGLIDLGAHHHDDFSNVSPLEQEVLDEYARLARNMERVSRSRPRNEMVIYFSRLLAWFSSLLHGLFV